MKLIVALVLSVFVMQSAAARAETLFMVADIWCPYNCDPASDHPGYMIELAQKAFAKHDIDIEYTTMPWTRAIEETRQQKHNAIVGAGQADAPDFVFPKLPQGTSELMFYVKKGDSWRYTTFDSLAQVSLSVVADYSYSDEMDAYVLKNKDNAQLIQVVSGDNALETNFRKLANNRVTVIIDDLYVVEHYLSQHPDIKEQVEVAGSYSMVDVFIAFSPGDPNSQKYADILAEETEAMRTSGELKEILDRYGLTDFQHSPERE